MSRNYDAIGGIGWSDGVRRLLKMSVSIDTNLILEALWSTEVTDAQ